MDTLFRDLAFFTIQWDTPIVQVDKLSREALNNPSPWEIWHPSNFVLLEFGGKMLAKG